MKTIVPATLRLFLLLSITLLQATFTHSQSAPEMQFDSYSQVPGTGSFGSVNSVYRFTNVMSGADALLTIRDRSSSSVRITSFDMTSTGFRRAFQPQIDNGSVSRSSNWWMEFEVTFVAAGTSTPSIQPRVDVTALDIDGDGGRLREYDAFYNPSSFTTERNTSLSVSDLVVGGSAVGRTFTGPQVTYNGIDTAQTDVMVTLTYSNVSSIRFRLGGTSSGSVSNTERMYSVWFRTFTYNAPTVTLPVKLAAFNALLSTEKKAQLSWTTVSEINASHFVVERSFNGQDFKEAGMVFAYGSENSRTNYQFQENLASVSNPLVYYRLRCVDQDGKTEYSEVRVLRLGSKATQQVQLLTYPNPVQNELRITIPAEWQNKRVVYEIFTANGQTARRVDNPNSSQTETISMNNLAPGFYIVKVSNGTEVTQQRIVKQ